ncbi:MAG TPA: ABC transporter ATP-binding protein [Candidatus Limnocylindrales bacterium]|nr:ABC transporter ATP-binding protein [Candidatus Limnocylindrales bacterium]
MTAALEVDGLAKAYGGRRVLDDVTFAVDAGTIVGLLGPNGAGKTTTVEIIEGYRRPDAGRATVLGLDPLGDANRVRPCVGVMLQAGGLYPLATVREALRLFASYYAAPDDPARLLGLLGLEKVAGSRIRTLSGGERQRLSLGLALVGRPDVLVLDEPTAGMDPAARQATRALLDGQRREGRAILLTTHELVDVERLADRVVVLDRGRVVADDTPDAIAGAGPPVMRFRLAGPVADDDLLELATRLDGPVDRDPDGWLRVGGPAEPARVTALARWCETRGLPLSELRVGGGTLEERYLELVRGPEEP